MPSFALTFYRHFQTTSFIPCAVESLTRILCIPTPHFIIEPAFRRGTQKNRLFDVSDFFRASAPGIGERRGVLGRSV